MKVVYSMTWDKRKEAKMIMSSDLRWELMYKQEGKCKVCGVEEWRLRKKLQAHRLLKGRNGGLYTVENVILVCHTCHNKIEREY